MTRETLAAFVLCFGVGPALYAAFLRMGRPAVVPTGFGVVLAVGLAAWLQSQQMGLGTLAALWLAWVLAVAVAASALKLRLRAPSLRRLVIVAGLLATTLPWFGLATAQLVTS